MLNTVVALQSPENEVEFSLVRIGSKIEMGLPITSSAPYPYDYCAPTSGFDSSFQ
jgi:hypothetical protein